MNIKIGFSDAGKNTAIRFLLSCLLISLVSGSLSGQTIPYRLLADDILTPTGGTVDPVNKDIYVVEMGTFKKTSDYSVTISRPKGAEANYPVSVDYQFLPGSSFCFAISETPNNPNPSMEIPFTGTLTFAPGETSKILYIKVRPNIAEDPSFQLMTENFTTAYLLFSYANRAAIKHSVVQMNFTNPVAVTYPTLGSVNDTINRMRTDAFHSGEIGGYLLINAAYTTDFATRYSIITQQQQMTITGYQLNHNAFSANSSDMSNATSRRFSLSPREVNSTTERAVFLYKLQEESIISNYTDGIMWTKPTPLIPFIYDRIERVKQVGAEALGIVNGEVAIDMNDGSDRNIELSQFYIPPRLGTITTDKTEYEKGEAVRINIPFLNWKLYKKIYENAWLDEILLTIDNGATFITSNKSFNESTGILSFLFNAPEVADGAEKTIYAEILVRKNYTYWEPRLVYPPGAFVPVTIKSQVAPVVFTESIEISGHPAYNILFLEKQKTVQLSYSVLPENSSFLHATWSSNNPEIGEISSSGLVTAKKPGNLTLTLTSDEVAYRRENGLPDNDGALIRTARIIVKDSVPKLQGMNEWHAMEGETKVEFFYNLTGEWKVKNNKAVVTLTHANGKKKTSEINITLSDGIISYTVPFDSDFPKLPSANSATPTCRVKMELTLVDSENAQEYTIEGEANVFIYYRQMQFKSKHIEDINTGEPVNVKVEIDYLPPGNYRIEYQITSQYLPSGWGGPVPTFQTYDSGGALPEWLTVEPMEDGYRRALLNTEFTPYDIIENTYNVVLRVVDSSYRVKEETLAVATIHRINTAGWNGLVVHNTETDNFAAIRNFEDKIAAKSFTELPGAMEAVLNGAIKRFSLHAPAIWGEPVCSFTGGAVRKNNYDQGEFMVIHPMDGESHTIKAEWPKVGLEYTFSYICNPAPPANGVYAFNVVYSYESHQKQTPYGETFEMQYTTAANELKTMPLIPFRTYAFPNGEIYKETVFIYEPDTISGSAYLLSDNRKRLPTELTNLREGLSYGLHERGYYSVNPYSINDFLVNHEMPDFIINVLDEEGNSIPNAKVNYALAGYDSDTRDAVPLDNPVEGSETTDENGKIIIPMEDLDIDSSSGVGYIMLEVLAEGFKPQVIRRHVQNADLMSEYKIYKSQASDFNVDAVLKNIESQSICTEAKLSYRSFHHETMRNPQGVYRTVPFFEENTVDLTNLPANSITPFRGQAELSLSIPYEGNIANIRLGGTGIDSTLTASIDRYDRINKEDFGFENNYATLRFYINTDGAENRVYYLHWDRSYWGYNPTEDWCAPQQSTRLYLKDDTGIIAELSGITNQDVDASVISDNIEDFEIPMHDPQNDQIGSVAANNGKSFDANKEFNMSGAFSEFDITMPSSLPFTMNVRREDGKTYIRGILSYNFLDNLAPGASQAQELANLGSDFLNTFDDIRDAVNDTRKADWKWMPQPKRIFGFVGDVFVGIKGYCEGVVFYNPVTKKHEITFSDAGIGLEAGGIYSLFPSVGGAFIGVDVGVQMEARLEAYLSAYNVALDQEDYDEMIRLDIQLETSFKAALHAWVAVGFDLWIAHAKAGVKGSVALIHKNRFDFPTYQGGEIKSGMSTRLGGNLVAFAKAGFLFFSVGKEWELVGFDNTFLTPNNSTNPYWRGFRSDSFSPPILQADNPSVNIKLRSAGYQPLNLRSGSNLNKLIDNIDSSAEPRYLFGGKSLAFSNMKVPEDNNDDRLQIFSNGKSTDLITAETPSFAFDVASTANQAVVAYEQLSEPVVEAELTANSLETAMKKQASNAKIMAAIYKNNIWTADTLSLNNFVNMAPGVALQKSDGKAAAIWSSGNLTDVNNSQFITGDLLFSRYDGTKWNDPISIAGLDKNHVYSDYRMIMANDTALIVASRSVTEENNSSVSGIVFISIAPNNTVSTYVSGDKGGKAQLVRVGDINFVSFLSRTPDGQQDVKMMTVDMFGHPAGKINSFAGMSG